ncbi:MAG: hypothetical protein ACI4DK_13170 [Lachnospiraceae bacterium]
MENRTDYEKEIKESVFFFKGIIGMALLMIVFLIGRIISWEREFSLCYICSVIVEIIFLVCYGIYGIYVSKKGRMDIPQDAQVIRESETGVKAFPYLYVLGILIAILAFDCAISGDSTCFFVLPISFIEFLLALYLYSSYYRRCVIVTDREITYVNFLGKAKVYPREKWEELKQSKWSRDFDGLSEEKKKPKVNWSTVVFWIVNAIYVLYFFVFWYWLDDNEIYYRFGFIVTLFTYVPAIHSIFQNIAIFMKKKHAGLYLILGLLIWFFVLCFTAGQGV